MSSEAGDPPPPTPVADKSACENGASCSTQFPPNRQVGQSGVEGVCRHEWLPGVNPFFDDGEKCPSHTDDDKMVAARRVACVLALHGVRGYGRVLDYLETHHKRDVAVWRKENRMHPPREASEPRARSLHTLCLIADSGIIPKTARQSASHVGGLAPGKGEKHPHPFGDAGNATYALFVKELLAEVQTAHDRSQVPSRSKAGYCELLKFSEEQRAHVVQAYLGAADAAKKFEDNIDCDVPWHRVYRGMAGGEFTQKDEAARLITGWMERHHANLTPVSG